MQDLEHLLISLTAQMTASMLKVLGEVAGIGGLALGVFLVIFREVIRKKIFPRLSQKQGYSLLRLILVLAWTVGILGLAAWTYLAAKPAPKFATGHLEVTDIVIDDYREDFSALIDFRVVNRGTQSLSVSRVRFDVIETKTIPTKGSLDFSGRYDLDISHLIKPGDHDEAVVAQALQPGEVDRFAVILTARALGTGVFRMWRLKPTITTSEGDVSVHAITVALPFDITKSLLEPGERERNQPKLDDCSSKANAAFKQHSISKSERDSRLLECRLLYPVE